MRILLVEDSRRVVSVVCAALKNTAYSVTAASTCAGASRELAASSFDLAILDVGLPDGSGLDVCRQARSAGYDLPMLLLTARADVSDRVAGLDAGADDYLGKPFASAELVARIRALARRGPRWTDSRREFGTLLIDRDRRVIARGEAQLALTPREFEIVALLAWADGRVVARDDLLESIWGDATEGAAASLDVLLARIRRKLATRESGDVIRTVRNVGYSWALERSKQR